MAMPPEQRLRDVACPQCGKAFRLRWNDYTATPGTGSHPIGTVMDDLMPGVFPPLMHPDEMDKQTLMLRGCPSGGIYDVAISCPHCDYEEEL